MNVFVVEDDEWYAEYIAYTLSLDQDISVKKFPDAKSLLEKLAEGPEVITMDYQLPDMSGEELLKRIKEKSPNTEVLVISKQDKIQTAVELLKMGAYDYIVKSDDIRDRLLNVMRNVKNHLMLKKQVTHLEQEVSRKYNFEKQIIGESEQIRKVYQLIKKAINTDIVVTITGETGTGKEMVAKAIHFNSQRARQPFVAINMAAIPKELVESELFGHEKGAFTGASFSRKGKFEEAHNGTLFLDEIGDLDLALQAKLLRVLQEKEVQRLGSNKTIKTNCRIVVATNKNLLDMVKAGSFRDDLYYRLFGLTIQLPPLRDRNTDILMLASYFVKEFCKTQQLPAKTLTKNAQNKLMDYHYPGNIRELKSVVELAAVMSDENEIDENDITFSHERGSIQQIDHQLTLKEHNYRIVKSYLDHANGNVKEAARKLDIGFSTIYRMLKSEDT
jgi:DNA-binding NtrC family response regulator